MEFLSLLPLQITLFLLLLTPFILQSRYYSSASSDVDIVLHKIMPSLKGNSESLLLSSWNTSVPLCQWKGLKWVFTNGTILSCKKDDLSSSLQWSNLFLFKETSLNLLSIQLPSANLSGVVPSELGELNNLESIYLSVNALSGGVPLELGYSLSLSVIDLGNNLLKGPLPTSIWNLCDQLVSLNLHGNSLSGTIPEPGLPNATCPNLHFLDLGHNMFSGGFPEFITRFVGLEEVDLSSNMLSGGVPQSVSGMQLERFNLSYNNLTGMMPNLGNWKLGPQVFDGNPGLCGQPLRPCGGKSPGLSSGSIAGMVIGFMTGAVVLVSLLIGYSHSKKRKTADEEVDTEEDEDDDDEDGRGNDGKLILFQGGEHLTLEDVLNATGQVMEKTSYGTVYKAKLADGGTIALRLLREGSCNDKGSCLHVVRKLGKIRHENLIPLRAFYQGKRGEKLLIYDYQFQKTLDDLLHESRIGKPSLNWARRHKIALGIAKGLAHLHGLEIPITQGNVRSKNVLVDDFFIPRLTEFGLYKIMVSNVADEIVTLAKVDGYKAPELQKMKQCNSRTDVYAFGILLLEILLGRKPGKNGRNGDLTDLPSLVKVAVLEETTMEIFDMELIKGMRSPMEDGLVQALKLAMGCCSPVPSVRPTMDEVVRQLEENRPRNKSALYSPAETRSESGTPF